MALGIVYGLPLPHTSWDLGPHQYLFGDRSALHKFNSPEPLMGRPGLWNWRAVDNSTVSDAGWTVTELMLPLPHKGLRPDSLELIGACSCEVVRALIGLSLIHI